MKTCGCIIDYQPIPGHEDSTAAPMEEVKITTCEMHTPEE